MELDSQIVKYMQKRAELATNVAGALAAQCFVLAVFFCAYGLFKSGVVFSKSEDIAKVIIIVISIVITVALCVFNVMLCIKLQSLQKLYPDEIALRQSFDTVDAAYEIARPILIFKITASIVVMTLGGLAYIFLMILLEKSFMSGIYGKIAASSLFGVALLIGLPSFDRIKVYLEMMNVRHADRNSLRGIFPYAIAVAIGLPVSIEGYYIMKCYAGKSDIAFIVFWMVALFALAFAYLSGFINKDC